MTVQLDTDRNLFDREDIAQIFNELNECIGDGPRLRVVWAEQT